MCDDDLGGHVCVSSSLSFEEFAARQQGEKYDHVFIGTYLWNVSWVYFYWKNVPCHGSFYCKCPLLTNDKHSTAPTKTWILSS